MIDLRSDTGTLPTPQMYEAVLAARLGDDAYGEDPTVRELEERTAALLGHEAALFVPSGTMGNLVAVLALAPAGAQVVVGDACDMLRYEGDGAVRCAGVRWATVPTQPDGTLPLDRLQQVLTGSPAMLCLEDTHTLSGGRVLTPAYLAQAAGMARDAGVPVHLDGARLWNAAVALRVPVRELAAHADTVQVCLSKGLGAPAGALLAGSRSVVSRARAARHALGGGMRQSGVLAAPGLVALGRIDRLAEDHATAQLLARGLAALPGVGVHPEHVETNIVMFRVDPALLPWQQVQVRAREAGLALSAPGDGRLRAVTSCGTGPEVVGRAVRLLAGVLERARPPARPPAPADQLVPALR